MANQGSDATLNDAVGDKIRDWLQLTKNGHGPLKEGEKASSRAYMYALQQDWMVSVMPFLDVHSATASANTASITFTYTVQPQHCNRLHHLHGGATATLLDFCTSVPLSLVSRPGFWQYLGVSRCLTVSYLRPARAGDQVLIETEIVQVGKRLATLRGSIRRKEDGQLLCTAEHLKVNIDSAVSL
ncbi:Thioesterase superfamily, partial [Metarhizium brunneum ARSEF 3297]